MAGLFMQSKDIQVKRIVLILLLNLQFTTKSKKTLLYRQLDV